MLFKRQNLALENDVFPIFRLAENTRTAWETQENWPLRNLPSDTVCKNQILDKRGVMRYVIYIYRASVYICHMIHMWIYTSTFLDLEFISPPWIFGGRVSKNAEPGGISGFFFSSYLTAYIHPCKINGWNPKNHPIEIRKIIWTKKHPWLWVQNLWIFQVSSERSISPHFCWDSTSKESQQFWQGSPSLGNLGIPEKPRFPWNIALFLKTFFPSRHGGQKWVLGT